MKLVNTETGIEVKAGDTVVSFRGEKAIVGKLVGEQPRHSGSTGRIYVDVGMPSETGYYPSVYGCEWVD